MLIDGAACDILFESNDASFRATRDLTEAFFVDLKKSGFKRTVVTCREVITIAENKVHFKYCYYRESVDGRVMSKHDNVWIVTFKEDKWGIQVRSY